MAEKQELILAYLTLAGEKVDVAHKLVAVGYNDDALSRAYYAMFYAAKAALLTIDLSPGSHSGVVSQFSRNFVKTGQVERNYGRILARTMQARETSDYNPIKRALSAQAEQAIIDAEKFVERVRELLNPLLSGAGK